MSVAKTQRNEIIVELINNGMSERKIGKLVGISHAVVHNINKRFNKDRLNHRKCLLCRAAEDLINNDNLTVCKSCLKFIKDIA